MASESHIYRFSQNQKIVCSIIYAIVVAFKPKAPLNTAFANYNNELTYISL